MYHTQRYCHALYQFLWMIIFKNIINVIVVMCDNNECLYKDINPYLCVFSGDMNQYFKLPIQQQQVMSRFLEHLQKV